MSYEKYITYTTKKRFLDYKDSLFDYKDAINSFECFYSDIKRNNRRLHSALGYWEPNWFEKFSARDIVEQCTVIVFILSFLGMVIMAGCGIYFGIESPITKVVMGVWYLSIMIFTIVFLIILLVCLIKTINKQKRRGIKVMRRKKRDFDKWG